MQFLKKLKERAYAAAADASPDNGRFFVRDGTSKFEFLVDTGADVSVFPRRMVHQPTKETDYYLYSVTGQQFPTYGLHSVCVDLGLRRAFSWSFVIADTATAILGADFLGHFGLLVDVRNRRLVDMVTKLSTRGKVRPIDAPSIKTLTNEISAPYAVLLARYQNITVPPPPNEPPRHNTVHHITTTPGPPVSARPRRLAPERYRVARVELHQMVRDGIVAPSSSN